MNPGRRGLERRHPRSVPLARLPSAARTASRDSATIRCCSASRSASGTARIRSSRSACSASPTARATTARTSRSTTSTSTARRRTRTRRCSTSTRRRRSLTRQLVDREPAPRRATTSSTSCSTPACSTRTATGTSSSSTPRPSPRTSSIRITAVNRGPEPAVAARAAPALVPQHLVAMARSAPSPSWRPRSTRAATVVAAHHEQLGARYLYCDRAGRAAVHRQRDEPLPAVGPAEPDALPEGRHQRLHRQRPAGRREPRAHGDEGRPPIRPSTVAPGQSATRSAPPDRARPGALAEPFGPTSTRSSRPASARRTTSTRELIPASLSDDAEAWSARGTPACCGPSRPTSTTWSSG